MERFKGIYYKSDAPGGLSTTGNDSETEEGKPGYRSPLRATLDRMPTPTNALEALTLLLANDIAAVDEGRITPQQFEKTWEEIGKEIKGTSTETPKKSE